MQQKSHAQRHAGKQQVIRSRQAAAQPSKQAVALAAMRRAACAGKGRAELSAGLRVYLAFSRSGHRGLAGVEISFKAPLQGKI